MMTLSSVVTAFIIIVAVIIADILCGDVTNIRNSNNNPFSQIGYNNNNNAQHLKSTTTPWPALGQRRNQQQTSSTQQGNSQASNQPMWVRPNNSPNWVRNTPSNLGTNNKNTGSNPIRTSGSNNYNTNFLNGERGSQIGGPQNQRQSSNNLNANNGIRGTTPTTSTVVLKPVTSMGGGDTRNLNVNNNNNGMRGMMPAGSMNSGTGTSTQTGSQNQGSKSQNEGDVQDFELREFSEELLSKDTNNPFKYVTVNLQGMTTSRSTNDEAPLPLLSISNDAYSLPSIEKLMLLHNNYIVESNQNEVYTAQEKIEENNLLDTILTTSVMQHARNFLVKKGKIGKDPKDFKDLLRLIWFGMYSRGGGRIGSSGFEHIFLAELKNNQVSGLHNWLYFNEEEKKRNANYLGYMKKIDLGNKGAILKYHFTFQGVDKPVGSMFIGTSPELEMALYSVCFILRADKICPLKMNGNRFIIRTYTYRYRGKNMIGSAFPEI